MGYASLKDCVNDLEKHGQLRRVDIPIDPYLELAAVQRCAYKAQGPALLFTRVKGCRFPMLANLFGTMERLHFIFRDTLPALRHIFACKADPMYALRHMGSSLSLLRHLWHIRPQKVHSGAVLQEQTSLDGLPQLQSWPQDGGAFITLPLVYSEHPDKNGVAGSNIGMYRVQLSGNAYAADEVGLHYQIHRGIGPHHAAALQHGQALPVNIFVGGPPAMTIAAVMPLPEGIPECVFAGVLGGRRIAMIHGKQPLPIWADADFCLCGHILPQCKPEGPFGDHLGYYSLTHDFPVVRVNAIYHKKDAIWPFTSVGRPPQEDTVLGAFIHELTGPLVPQVFHGVHEVHAVDAAGVHPLLLAIGSERYVPYADARRPQELLTSAMNILGTTQTALAKFLFISAKEDAPALTTHDIPAFFKHILERTDFANDLHFITRTHTDTLDYTGTGLNQGSKLIWAAAGEPKRTLATSLPASLPLPEGFSAPTLMAPGIILVQGKRHTSARGEQDASMQLLAQRLGSLPEADTFPLLVVVDDTDFAARSWDNFLWLTFTRADPAQDIYGVRAGVQCKHWTCEAPVIIDARLKSFQAPPLEEPVYVTQRLELLAAPGGPLHGII